MSLYSAFKTDENIERLGIVLDYGSFRIRVARAGGSNKRFARVFEQKLKPVRQALKADQLQEEIGDRILAEVYADAVILDWETLIDGEFKKGIEAEDGSLLPFNVKNVQETLQNLPELFTDIREQTTKFSNFRALDKEADAANL